MRKKCEWQLEKEKLHAAIKKDFNYMTTTLCTKKITYKHLIAPYKFSIYFFDNLVTAVHCEHSMNFEKKCVSEYFVSIGLADLRNNTFCVICQEKEKIVDLIELIDDASPLGNIKSDLMFHLGIKKSEKDITNDISENVYQGKFSEAIKLVLEAQEMGYYDVTWALVERLHEDNLINELELIGIYESIKKENHYFKEANERLFVLYSEKNLNKEIKNNPYLYLEKQLKASVLADNITLINQTLHTLTSNKGIKNNKEEKSLVDILIELSSEIRTLKSDNKRLESEIRTLKSDNKRLEDVQNSSSTSCKKTTFF